MNDLIIKAQKIKVAIFDVDGVFTDGSLLYDTNGIESKSFHVHDGLGIKLLQKSGVEIAIITARQSAMVAKRMQELSVQHVYQGYEDKLEAYTEAKKLFAVDDEAIAYMGDDLQDLPLLSRAGLNVTVANAPDIIKQHAALVTGLSGGQGAVREFCEWLMRAQNTYDTVIKSYFNR